MLLPLTLLLAASMPVQLAEAQHAITAGRLDQAREMIASAVKSGASGPQVDSLLAELAFERGDDAQSFALGTALLRGDGKNVRLLERTGISALRLHHINEARAFLGAATRLPAASWRAWNGLAVLADATGDWSAADLAYTRAVALAPDRAELVNNHGWSLLLRGEWQRAQEELAAAAALAPGNQRIANNAELAREANARDLPQRSPGEADNAWAARLNDAGVAAAVSGDRARAVAAFARAIEASPSWSSRTAANLAAVAKP